MVWTVEHRRRPYEPGHRRYHYVVHGRERASALAELNFAMD